MLEACVVLLPHDGLQHREAERQEVEPTQSRPGTVSLQEIKAKCASGFARPHRVVGEVCVTIVCTATHTRRHQLHRSIVLQSNNGANSKRGLSVQLTTVETCLRGTAQREKACIRAAKTGEEHVLAHTMSFLCEQPLCVG